MSKHTRASIVARASAIALGVVLASCRLVPASPDTLVLTPQTVLIVVPAVPQEEGNECGLASLATLCDYYGVELPAAARERLARLAEERDGLSGGELRAALREAGFEAYLFQGTLDWETTGLYHQIDSRRPPLVMISHDGEKQHACLVTGYDCSTESIYVYDPRRGHLRIPTSDFEALWRNARFFTLLALPRAPDREEEEPVEETSTDAAVRIVAR